MQRMDIGKWNAQTTFKENVDITLISKEDNSNYCQMNINISKNKYFNYFKEIKTCWIDK